MNHIPILMPAALPEPAIAALDRRFTLHRLWEQPDPDAFLREHGATIRGLAANTLAGPVGAALFDRLPKLEIVANFGVGYDNIDAPAAADRGIMVTNTPGVLDAEVADLAIGLLLATIRRLPQADRYVRDGKWEDADFPLSPTLRGRTIGILGLGGIGRQIARRLEGFDVAIAYHQRHPRDDVDYPYHNTPAKLAAACDVLIVIVPGGAGTRHLVDAKVLAALGSDGILVNVARGSVVDPSALIAALRDHTILAAGLDVYPDEPHVPTELRAMDQVVLLPHLGSASEHTRAAMGQLVVDNLVNWFTHGKALTPVSETA